MKKNQQKHLLFLGILLFFIVIVFTYYGINLTDFNRVYFFCPVIILFVFGIVGVIICCIYQITKNQNMQKQVEKIWIFVCTNVLIIFILLASLYQFSNQMLKQEKMNKDQVLYSFYLLND